MICRHVYSMRHGVSSGGRGGLGVHGSGAAAPPRRPSRHRGGLVTADSNAGARVAELYPSLAPGYPDTTYQTLDPAALAGLDVVFLALPHGESQRIAAELVDTRRSRRRPRRRLPAAGRRVRAVVRRRPHRARAARPVRVRPPRALPRRRSPRAQHVASPGCYPTAAALALAPLLADGLVEPTGIVVDAMSGVSGAGRGAEGHEPLLRGQRERRAPTACSRIATPPRWSSRSPTSAGSRCRCCSRRTSCR